MLDFLLWCGYTRNMEKKNYIAIKIDDNMKDWLFSKARKDTTTDNISEVVRKAVQFYRKNDKI